MIDTTEEALNAFSLENVDNFYFFLLPAELDLCYIIHYTLYNQSPVSLSPILWHKVNLAG